MNSEGDVKTHSYERVNLAATAKDISSLNSVPHIPGANLTPEMVVTDPGTSFIHTRLNSAPYKINMTRSTSYTIALSDPDLSKSLKEASPIRPYNQPNSASGAARARFEKLVRR